MSHVRYLIDESLPLALVAGLRRREPAIDVWRVGQQGMPAFGADDADILVFCEKAQRMLVSLDRATLPGHAGEHVDAGHHTNGVLLVTRRCTLRMMLEDLLLVWSTTDADEWLDVVAYLPL